VAGDAEATADDPPPTPSYARAMTETPPPPAPAPSLGRVGMWTAGFDGVPVAAAQEAAAELEDLGYGTLWFGEAYGRESLTQAAVLLAATERAVVATGITSIHGRDPVAARAGQATLLDGYPDRFLLGLGVSHRPLVERFRGGEYGSPLAEMRAYLDAMDEITPVAAGGDRPAPRVLAALGPKMLELAAERCAGAHPYLVTPDHTATARAALGDDRVLAVEQAVVLTDDRDVARERAHTHLEIYTGLPNYRRSWERQGFGDEDFVRGGSDRLKDALVAWGDIDACAARVREHLEAGADHVCVQVLGEHPLALPLDDLRALAPALTSL